MVYAVVGAMVIGLSLGMLGSGGSILTVPVLLYLMHHQDKVAIAESLAIVGAIAMVSALPYAADRLVHWRSVVLFGLPGMAGTYLGAWLAGFVTGSIQLFVFAGVMLLAAVQMWRKGARRASADAPTDDPAHRSPIRIGAEGAGVGVLTGFVGVGGGFLIVPALVLLGRLSMRRAVATSLAIIAMNSAVGFLKHLDVLDRLDLRVDWGAIALFAAVGAVGGFAGRALNARLPQGALQRGFAVFLVAMAGFIVFRESASLTSHLTPNAPATPAQGELP